MEYEADGHFWLNDEAAAVRGHLAFSQDNGGELRLEQILVGPGGDLAFETDLLHGQTLDRTPLACLDTFVTETKLAMPKMPLGPQSLLVNSLLVGTGDPNEPFGVIRLSIHGLLDWTNQSGLAVVGEHQQPDQPVTVTWEPAPDTPTATVDDVEVELITEHRFKGEDHEFCLEHRAEVELRGEPRPFEEWHRHAGGVEGFITFFLGYPAWIDRFNAPREEEGDVDLIYRRRETSPPNRRGPWVPLPVIVDDFQPALEGWFGLMDSDQEAFEILSEYIRVGGRLLHQDQLLYLARIIELYHRGGDRFEQVVIPKDEHKERVAEILEASPDEHKDFLTKALSRSNEKTLRERIKELVESFGPALAPITAGDLDGFAGAATDNRNWHTHYSSSYKEKGKVAEGMDLYRLVRRLLMVVRACVLREMSFGNDAIAALLARDRMYQDLSEKV